MSQWQDVLIRKALNDVGEVPFTGGTWTQSPDIIPNGTKVVADPQAAFGGANYNIDQGQSTVFMQPNYFYVRGKNLSPGPQTATFSLYYCPQNLFLFPSLWAKHQLSTSSGKPSVTVEAAASGDVIVTPEAFTYIPESQIHSCLVARVSTPTNPNPVPPDGTFTTFDQLGQFIVNNPNWGWRNVVLVEKDIPTFTNTFEIDTTCLTPGTNGQFLIGISYNNLSVGSQLAFSAGTPIPSGPDQGKIIQMVQTAVTQPDGSLGTAYLTIPAGYKTTVQYTYWAKAPIQAGWQVRFYAILITNPASVVYGHSAPLHHLGIPGFDAGHPLMALAANGITRGLRLGDVSTIGR